MPSTVDQYGAPLSALFEAFATPFERARHATADSNSRRWLAHKGAVRRMERSRAGRERLLAFGQGYTAGWTLARAGV